MDPINLTEYTIGTEPNPVTCVIRQGREYSINFSCLNSEGVIVIPDSIFYLTCLIFAWSFVISPSIKSILENVIKEIVPKDYKIKIDWVLLHWKKIDIGVVVIILITIYVILI